MKTGEDAPNDVLSYILKSMDEDSTEYEELLDHFMTFFAAGIKIEFTSVDILLG